MAYIAHAAVRLKNDYSAYEKDKWYSIESDQDIEFRWRLKANRIYEVVAGVFDNRDTALYYAKHMYVTMLYNLLYKDIGIAEGSRSFYEKRFYDPAIDNSLEEFCQNENFFFWNQRYSGGGIGVDVYEVKDSIDELDLYRFIGIKMSAISPKPELSFDNYGKCSFPYNRESHEILNNILIADGVFDIGMKMTIYCGILEHIAEDQDKEDEVLQEMNALIEHVQNSELSSAQKESLKNYILTGKKISARQKCRLIANKYGKTKYGEYSIKDILNDAYSIRSIFSHGGDCSDKYSGPAFLIKYIVLDVLEGYMKEKYL